MLNLFSKWQKEKKKKKEEEGFCGFSSCQISK
jgi:hypothetical protein